MSSPQSPTPSLTSASTISGGIGGGYVSDDGSYDSPNSAYNEEDGFEVVGSPPSSNVSERNVARGTTSTNNTTTSASSQGAAGAQDTTGGTSGSASARGTTRAQDTKERTNGSAGAQGATGSQAGIGRDQGEEWKSWIKWDQCAV